MVLVPVGDCCENPAAPVYENVPSHPQLPVKPIAADTPSVHESATSHPQLPDEPIAAATPSTTTLGQEEGDETEDEQWSNDRDIGRKEKSLALLTCHYCNKCQWTLFDCEICKKRCCKKDTFWCSVDECGYQICRECQEGPTVRVTKDYYRWCCPVCYMSTCRICSDADIGDSCDECQGPLCKKHIFYCSQSNCEKMICVKCQDDGWGSFTLTGKGWFCGQHTWG